jgi:hypothetical protein
MGVALPGENIMDAESRVKLAEISGEIKLIRQSQEQYTKDVDRAARDNLEFQRTTNDRLHTHGARIQVLESASIRKEGVKEGTERTFKAGALIASALGSGGIVAIIAFFARLFHV